MAGTKTKKPKRGFGQVRELPSGRLQARYIGPDLARHNGPTTYDASIDAEGWLAAERRLIEMEVWTPPAERAAARNRPVEVLTFGTFATNWLADRDLKPRTREHYQKLLDNQLSGLGDQPVKSLTPVEIRAWYNTLDKKRPTLRSHAFSLVRAILNTAVRDGLFEGRSNPAQIRGAGNSKRVHKIEPASLPELEALVLALPARYRLMPLLAAWCALRFGELAELRTSDINVEGAVIKVRRGVVRANGEVIIGSPKSDAGTRDVAIPPHLLPTIRDHIAEHAGPGRQGLVFPAARDRTKNLAPSTFYKVYYPARDAAGRPDLHFHDLRHTGAVLAALTGATLAELMGRLGHSTPGAALRYQHAARGRDAEIAASLSKMAKAARSPKKTKGAK